jgi:transposase
MNGMLDVVGVDVSKRKLDIAWKRGERVQLKVFDNDAAGHAQMLGWLKAKGVTAAQCHVAMEATSTYYESLALYLVAAGFTVSVVNPLRIKGYAESRLVRQKTDRADARLIACFCAEQSPEAWVPPAPEVRELQRLVARWEAVRDLATQERLRLHEAQGEARASVERILAVLEGERAALEALIRGHIDRHPGLRQQREWLLSIPGIGPVLSAYLMAWLPIERFDNPRQAAAFVGVCPQHRESGDSVRGKPRMSKIGHARLRRMLYLPAMSALRSNPAARALAARLKARGKPGKLIIGAIMRKLIHWAVGVLKSKSNFNPALALAHA